MAGPWLMLRFPRTRQQILCIIVIIVYQIDSAVK